MCIGQNLRAVFMFIHEINFFHMCTRMISSLIILLVEISKYVYANKDR